MADTPYKVLLLIASILVTLYFLLHRWRYNRFANIPSPLKRNLFVGHLGYIAAEFKKAGSSTIHPDYVLENIWRANGCPEFMFLDTRPANHPLALIASHDIAEQITKSTKQQPYSTTKSRTIQEGFGRLVGKLSLLTQEGESWKALRKQFNPGFAPQHLLSLLPVLVCKTGIFVDKLDALAKSGTATELEPLCTNVTFDIIGEVVTDTDCKAQDETQSNDMVKYFKSLVATYAMSSGLTFDWLNLSLQARRYVYGKRLDDAVKKCVKGKYEDMQAGRSDKTDRSVLALALKDTEDLTPLILQSITDQVKTFMFAGHDTTSILLQRVFYALSIHPACLKKIRAEHDAIFGDSDPKEVILARPDETMKALVYTSACIKETLRLWPPAATARMSHNGLKIRTSEGEEVCLDDCVLYLVQHIIHRDRKVYGETADDFVPERWVGDIDTSSATVDEEGSTTGASKIPISSWRPFERGPRNCIGQELANLEARVILACVMRRYDFVKVGLGEAEIDEKDQPIVDEKGKYRTKSELLSTMSITSKPIDKTVMRIQFHEAAT
ncbi:cytochrome P450 [Ophiobolus disseminans]|uniref:Cytochrome P450 n=1 Tax=Ophiobolus disseminans TaxID=1469910 RepID=A0A6A7AH43_9PLEO|nr:cytochrome P450 [Ophiobolus disseminans]